MGRRRGDTLSVLDLVVCPIDGGELERQGDELVCPGEHSFPYVDGIPVLLDDTLPRTHRVIDKSLADARAGRVDRRQLARGEVDPVVEDAVAATCGHLYRHLVGRLPRYPIPRLRLPEGRGRLFLDIGSSWGRWSLAAARLGYLPIGVDPSLEAIAAAKRIAHQHGIESLFVVADARQLPFRDASVDVAFSYSVFQHFAKDNVRQAFREIARVLTPGGTSLIQMGNRRGVRSVYRRLRGEHGPAPEFAVRYWTPDELRASCDEDIGPSEIEVDGFFSLNAQASDVDLLPRHLCAVVRASEAARALAGVVPRLTRVADSIYVRSVAR